MQSKPIVFCDFDGTVTALDVTDQILARLADPAWQAVERQWTQGLIGSRECLERQMGMVDASVKELNSVIDSVPIDPHFSSLFRFFRERDVPFYVLSDSFDYIIGRVLKRCGVNGALRNGTHLFSSTLRIKGGRLALAYPHADPPCKHGCATCKAAIIRRLGRGRDPIIFIGDGFSDRFAVEESDWIFAKHQLLAYCREKGIECRAFRTFKDVEEQLKPLLEERLPRGSRRPRRARR